MKQYPSTLRILEWNFTNLFQDWGDRSSRGCATTCYRQNRLATGEIFIVSKNHCHDSYGEFQLIHVWFLWIIFSNYFPRSPRSSRSLRPRRPNRNAFLMLCILLVSNSFAFSPFDFTTSHPHMTVWNVRNLVPLHWVDHFHSSLSVLFTFFMCSLYHNLYSLLESKETCFIYAFVSFYFVWFD